MMVSIRSTISRRRFWMAGAAVLFMALLGARSAPAQAPDQVPRYSFRVEIDGIGAGMFREVSGLSVETEVVEHRDGSGGGVRKLPGRTGWPDIVLKRGFTGNTELYEWATAYARTGTLLRRSGSVVMLSGSGQTIARWNFVNAWPSKWDGPVLKGSGNDVAVETLVLAHEGLTLSVEDR